MIGEANRLSFQGKVFMMKVTLAAILMGLGLATPALATDNVLPSQDRVQLAQADGFRSNRTVVIRRDSDRRPGFGRSDLGRPGFGRSDFGRPGFGRRGGGNKTVIIRRGGDQGASTTTIIRR